MPSRHVPPPTSARPAAPKKPNIPHHPVTGIPTKNPIVAKSTVSVGKANKATGNGKSPFCRTRPQKLPISGTRAPGRPRSNRLGPMNLRNNLPRLPITQKAARASRRGGQKYIVYCASGAANSGNNGLCTC